MYILFAQTIIWKIIIKPMNKKQKWECPNCKETIMLEMWHSVAQCKKCGTLMRTIHWKKKG